MTDLATYLAVGELVQAAAHQFGIVGPVPYEVLEPREELGSNKASQDEVAVGGLSK